MNHGDLPRYVLVELITYKGPPLLRELPKYIPIPVSTFPCRYHCCTQEYVPLQVCYAKTVHTFQGHNAGEVQEGQVPNPIKRIICDPGPRSFEGNNPGLLYTICTRATTLGDFDDPMTSALYFDGSNMCDDRVLDLRLGADKEVYKKVQLRDLLDDYMKKHRLTLSTPRADREQITGWAKTFQVSFGDLLL